MSTSIESPSPMELLFPDFAAEHASTRRLLERFPDAQSDYKPHDMSRSIAEVATHIADIPGRGLSILTSNEMDASNRKPRTPLTTAAELVALHDEGVAAVMDALAKTNFTALDEMWQLRRGDQIMVRGKRRQLLRTVMMSHIIHHRGQLGVYYRLLDVPVPGMYGPSADDMAAMKPR